MILSFVDLGVLLAQKAKDLGSGVTSGVSNVMSATKAAFAGSPETVASSRQRVEQLRTNDKLVTHETKYQKLKELMDVHHLKLREVGKKNAIKIQYMASDIKTTHYIFTNIRITTEISSQASIGFGDRLLKLKFNLQFKPVNSDVKYSFCNVQFVFCRDKMNMTFCHRSTRRRHQQRHCNA